MMRIKQQKGVTLLEVLLTIFISGVGLMGLAALQLRAIQATNDSSQNSQGMWVLLDLVGRIQANPEGNYEADLKASTFCEPNNAPAVMCATYYNKATISGSKCSPDDLAQFDLWDTLCGTSHDGTTIGHQAWNLVEPQLTISCGPAGCNHYDLSLRWNNQNDQTQSNSAAFELELPL